MPGQERLGWFSRSREDYGKQARLSSEEDGASRFECVSAQHETDIPRKCCTRIHDFHRKPRKPRDNIALFVSGSVASAELATSWMWGSRDLRG